MRIIQIKINDENKKQSPSFDIRASEEGEELGISQVSIDILNAYINIAEVFMKKHPENCLNCPAFKLHRRCVESIEAVQNGIEVGL